MGYVYINLYKFIYIYTLAYIYFGIYTMGEPSKFLISNGFLDPHLQWFTMVGDQFLHGHCICLTLWKIMTTEAKPHRDGGAKWCQFYPILPTEFVVFGPSSLLRDILGQRGESQRSSPPWPQKCLHSSF